jgi:Flp pilus assembly protein TadG
VRIDLGGARRNARASGSEHMYTVDNDHSINSQLLYSSGKSVAPSRLLLATRRWRGKKSLHLRTTGQMIRLFSETRFGREEGQELLEAAFVIPILMTLLLGMVSLGRAYNISQSMTRAAREGALKLVLTSCATCGNSPYTAAYVQTNFVNPALTSAGLNLSNVQNYASRYVWIDPNASPAQVCGVQISFQYPYQLAIPFTSLNLSTVTLSTAAQMRMENQPATCSVGSSVP